MTDAGILATKKRESIHVSSLMSRQCELFFITRDPHPLRDGCGKQNRNNKKRPASVACDRCGRNKNRKTASRWILTRHAVNDGTASRWIYFKEINGKHKSGRKTANISHTIRRTTHTGENCRSLRGFFSSGEETSSLRHVSSMPLSTLFCRKEDDSPTVISFKDAQRSP